MARWFEFMGNHPFLFGLMAVLIIAFFMVEKQRSGKKVTPNALGLMVNNDHAQLIDIRPAAKFATGHIQGSRNIPFSDLPKQLEELKAISHPIIIICEMGIQAGSAVSLIGKPDVYRLDGGITGWQSAGMPLVGTQSAKSKKK